MMLAHGAGDTQRLQFDAVGEWDGEEQVGVAVRLDEHISAHIILHVS